MRLRAGIVMRADPGSGCNGGMPFPPPSRAPEHLRERIAPIAANRRGRRAVIRGTRRHAPQCATPAPHDNTPHHTSAERARRGTGRSFVRMYAVIETGGKQYRVTPGQTVEVELLPAEPGATVTLERVLMVSDDKRTLVGTPTVSGGRVVGIVAKEDRGPKIIVFKYKSKKRYRRKTGHRQDYTYLLITDIQADGESLVPSEDRKRYETWGTRAANRFEARLEAELTGAPTLTKASRATRAAASAEEGAEDNAIASDTEAQATDDTDDTEE
jgi:large subunit ribosomal protein L21